MDSSTYNPYQTFELSEDSSEEKNWAQKSIKKFHCTIKKKRLK